MIADRPRGDRPTLYRARHVHTPPVHPASDALLVRDGVILAAGPHDALDALAGHDVQRVDMRPCTILPGLVDSHCHLAQLGYLADAVDVSAAAAPDIATMQLVLSEARADPSGWIVGRGYVDYAIREQRSPTRQDLDVAVGDTPCVVYHASLHVCVVNSAGLAALGIDETRVDEERGAFGRDRSGRLDGRLVEGSMFDVFAAAISSRLGDDGPSMVAAATQHLAALGITSCVDANTTIDELSALTTAALSGQLSVRVGMLCRYEDLDDIVSGERFRRLPDKMLTIAGAKVFADGGMSSRTAAVEPPYVSPMGERGMLLLDEAALIAAARHCASLGIGLGVHAQGERAIAATIRAFRATDDGGPMLRRIEHGGALTPRLRAEAQGLGLIVASQPAFLSALGDGFMDAFGPERGAELYPFRSILDHAIQLVFGSDAPVVSASPWLGMRDAVLRTTAGGRSIGPAHALSMTEALTAYSLAAKHSGIPTADVGSLEAGQRADFVVVDRDPVHTIPADLLDLRVIQTVVAGRVVHTAPFRADTSLWRARSPYV